MYVSGIGALYVRRRPRVRIEAPQSGGGQERGMFVCICLYGCFRYRSAVCASSPPCEDRGPTERRGPGEGNEEWNSTNVPNGGAWSGLSNMQRGDGGQWNFRLFYHKFSDIY